MMNNKAQSQETFAQHSAKMNTLRSGVYELNNDKSIISIGGTFDGWTEDKIYEIIEELNKIGIKIIE